ncbi:MAG: glycosyltransferase family 4 protein [Cytophagales bacterium]|nr:glycosyltransferase family 4 protein [Cytophagales bacterium]
MKTSRVIHIVHDFLFGGVESFLFYIVQAQKQNPDLEVAILCCQSEELVANKRLLDLGVTIHYVQIKPFDLRWSNYTRICEIVSQYHVAQLHIYKPALLKVLASSGTPVLFTVHTAGAVRREGSLYQKLKSNLQVWQLNNHCAGVVNNSKYSQKFWIDKRVSAKNNFVIYNGVRFNKTFDKELPFNAFPVLRNKRIIGTTSRFIGWKRVDFLINAFSEVLKQEKDVILLLAGDGPEMTSLKKRAEDLGIEEKVVFAGFQNQVTAFQNAMDICVFPSVSEPFGLVAIECLHLGKPVVVMKDGGGLEELISMVEPELVVQSQKLLSEKLLELLKDKSIDKEDAISKRKSFSEKFDAQHTEKEYFNCYKILMKTNEENVVL